MGSIRLVPLSPAMQGDKGTVYSSQGPSPSSLSSPLPKAHCDSKNLPSIPGLDLPVAVLHCLAPTYLSAQDIFLV